MQRSVFHGLGRILLTIIGIALLIIFGVRAASQASSLAAVGGSGAKKTGVPISNVGQLAVIDTGTNSQQPLLPSELLAQQSSNDPGTGPEHLNKAAVSLKNDVQKVAADMDSQPGKRLHVK